MHLHLQLLLQKHPFIVEQYYLTFLAALFESAALFGNTARCDSPFTPPLCTPLDPMLMLCKI